MWQKLRTETRITNEPASGIFSRSASEARRPCSLLRQRATPIAVMTPSTRRMGPTTTKTSAKVISNLVDSGSLPPREVRSVCRRGSRKSTKKITTPTATTQMKSG